MGVGVSPTGGRGGEGRGGGWTRMVRNPTSLPSNLELVGIILPPDPSPHWPLPRVASSGGCSVMAGKCPCLLGNDAEYITSLTSMRGLQK